MSAFESEKLRKYVKGLKRSECFFILCSLPNCKVNVCFFFLVPTEIPIVKSKYVFKCRRCQGDNVEHRRT